MRVEFLNDDVKGILLIYIFPQNIRARNISAMAGVNDTVEDRITHRFRANIDFWEWLSYSVEDRVARLHVFSQQAAASSFLPSLHSTSPHHSPDPTQSDIAHIKREVTQEPRPKTYAAQTALDKLVVFSGMAGLVNGERWKQMSVFFSNMLH